MKRTTFAIASAIALLASAPAMAQDTGVYGGIGVKTIEFDAYSLEGRLGYQLNDFLSVEGQGAVGVIDDEELGVEIQEDYALGAFLRASAPLSNSVTGFARVGYNVSEFSVDGAGIDASESFDGIAFGGGLEYSWEGLSGIRLEYTAYDFGSIEGIDVGTADTVSLGFTRKF